MSQLGRREFIALLGGAAAWPLAAHSEQKKLHIVGFLGANTPAAAGHMTSAFVRRLEELGWTDGRNVMIEYRWAAGQTARFRTLAAELVSAGAGVIVTSGNAAAIGARQATASIPIVLASSADIIATGLVRSLSHPGGNVTGLTVAADDTAGKRLELLREVVPGLRRVGILSNPDAGTVEVDTIRQVAPTLGVMVELFAFRTVGDLDRISAHPERATIGALFVVSDPLVFTNRIAINAFAVREKLATVHRLREYVADGGLISYGPDFRIFFRRAADYVDKILKGTRAEDLPVEQPTTYQLAINIQTGKAIGLEIPPTLLARADEVIE